jgi:hypothetical protein
VKRIPMSEIIERNVIYRIQADASQLKQGTNEASKAFGSLENKAKDTGKDIEKAFENATQATGDYSEAIKKSDSETQRFSKSTGILQSVFNRLDSALGGSITRLTAFVKGLQGVTTSFQAAGKAASVFKTALLTTGVGALVVALGSLIAVLQGTQTGLNLVSDVTAVAKTSLDVLRDTFVGVARVGREFFAGNFAQAIKIFEEQVAGVTDRLVIANARTLRLQELQRRAFNEETANIRVKQELLNDEFDLREKIFDFENSAEARIKAANDLQDVRNRKLAIERKELETRLSLLKESFAITNTAQEDKALREVALLEAQILDINRQQSRVAIENAKLIRRITNEQKALKDAVKDVSDELIIQEGSLTAINKELSILRAQYEAMPRDASDFQAIVFELAALTAKARNETELYKDAIDDLLRSLDQAKNPLDLLPQAGQQTKDLIDAAGEQLKILSKFAADFKKKNEDLLNIERIKEGLVELTNIGLEFAKISAQQQTDLLDAQVRAQETRVQRFTELAREGNVAQLQLEEERLSKLLALREQAAQRERALTALQITAANALSVAQAIQSIIAGFRSGNILAGIANSIALAATVGSTILAIKNATSQIPAFYEGTDFVKLNGAPKGRDTVIARVNEGERIVPTDLNRQVLGMSNKELINYAKLGRELSTMRLKELSPSNSQVNMLPLIQEVASLRQDIKRLNMSMNVDQYGLYAGIQGASGKLTRRKNMTR